MKKNYGMRKRISCVTVIAALVGMCFAPMSSEAELAAESIGYGEENYVDLTGLDSYNGITLATGATVTKEELMNEGYSVNIEDFGAVALENRSSEDEDTYAIENTEAINAAIQNVAAAAGGTVVVPAGTFRVYTIELEDNVNLYLSDGAVLQAAKTVSYDFEGNMTEDAEDYYDNGEPGNYLQPEVNIYAGLQDGGHTYFANSMLYAADKKNIMIYGKGLIDGSQMNDEGSLDQVLSGQDPSNPTYRDEQVTTWFGNKAIALLRCENVVLCDFDILNGGHFAIINEGTKNMLVDNLIVDTNRDAFNIDCGQNITIQNSVFNSLTDDAIVFKASYGAGLMQPVQNCLVQNCVVCGYDAGSVLAGTYTTDKQAATDVDGPTARIKFGTESTCGFNTVTIDGVRFERSRGLCMESVDGSAIHDIIMVNAYMDTISSSPIYIRIGNRGRYPVTGNSTDTYVNGQDNVRLTNSGWILPQNSEDSDYEWQEYPIQQYFPSYSYANESVEMSNGKMLSVVDQENPVTVNENNYYEEEASGKFYEYRWDDEEKTYAVNYDAEIVVGDDIDERYYYGDAVGYSDLAAAYNIYIGNVKITNVDPRYPITLAGLVDSKIQNVTLENIDVTYRGGIRMQDAIEQQLITTDWEYTQYMTDPSVQTLQWLSNTFFSKNSSLLPRVIWDAETESWIDDPYNVPEMQEQYPEPTNFGILPAYGLYARHVEGLTLNNVAFGYEIEDERHAVVLDDCHQVTFTDFSADSADSVETVALITNEYKRNTGYEYVPNQEYLTTTCSDITGLESADVLEHTVEAPEPGTPADDLYSGETIASVETGYSYGENIWTYNGIDFALPVTVYRPFFSGLTDQEGKEGEPFAFTVAARNPASETEGAVDYDAADADLVYTADNLPEGAEFDKESKTFTWKTPVSGTYSVTFTIDDGVIPVSQEIEIFIQ